MKWLLMGFFLFPTLSNAFEPLNTDDAGTVAAGGNQIEQYFIFIKCNSSVYKESRIGFGIEDSRT